MSFLSLKQIQYSNSICGTLSAQKKGWRCPIADGVCAQTQTGRIETLFHRDASSGDRVHRFAFGGGCDACDAIFYPFDEEGARSGE